MESDGSSAAGAGTGNGNVNNRGISSGIGGGLASSESSWAARAAADAAATSAATDAASGGGHHADSTNPFLGGFRGRIGPVAEPLDPLMHARSHSYGLGDWLPPSDITRDRDLDVFAGALPGVPAAVDDDAVTPLTGGIVAGRDHQF